ncbi:multidrug effflux MFS transporter [Halovulum sp. GXIMD14793]
MTSKPAPLPDRVWLQRTSPPHLATMVLMAGMGPLAMNILLPSLPAMATYFETDYALVQLAVSGYLAMTGALQLIIGPLSDRFGRRPVVLAGLGIFILASLGCALSTNIWMFLACRMLQASAAAGMVLSRAVVRDMVESHKAASMIAYVTMGMAVIPMIGPTIGGYLGAHLGWQASFWLTFVVGLMVIVLVWLDLGETNQSQSSSLSSQFRSYPELIRSRRFWGYTLVATFSSGGFFAFLGGAPWVANEILGISQDRVGLYFAMIAIGYILGNYISGRTAEHLGMNKLMLAGAIVATVAGLIGLMLFAAGIVHPLSLFGPVAFLGVGNGLTLPSANAGIVSVRPKLAGSASGLGGAMTIGGGAILAAVTGALLTKETGAYALLGMISLSSALSIIAAIYVMVRSSNISD